MTKDELKKGMKLIEDAEDYFSKHMKYPDFKSGKVTQDEAKRWRAFDKGMLDLNHAQYYLGVAFTKAEYMEDYQKKELEKQ